MKRKLKKTQNFSSSQKLWKMYQYRDLSSLKLCQFWSLKIVQRHILYDSFTLSRSAIIPALIENGNKSLIAPITNIEKTSQQFLRPIRSTRRWALASFAYHQGTKEHFTLLLQIIQNSKFWNCQKIGNVGNCHCQILLMCGNNLTFQYDS